MQSSRLSVNSAATIDQAEHALADFEHKWNTAYPPIALSWRNNWQRIIPFFDYPPEIRRIIYTTNAIESVNMSLRKVSKNRGSFPNDEAVIKLYYLALSNIAKKMVYATKRLETGAKQVYYSI